jgi:hypothetical protein
VQDVRLQQLLEFLKILNPFPGGPFCRIDARKFYKSGWLSHLI